MNPIRWLAIRLGRQPWLPKFAKYIVGLDVLIQRLTRGRFTLLSLAGLPELLLTVARTEERHPALHAAALRAARGRLAGGRLELGCAEAARVGGKPRRSRPGHRHLPRAADRRDAPPRGRRRAGGVLAGDAGDLAQLRASTPSARTARSRCSCCGRCDRASSDRLTVACTSPDFETRRAGLRFAQVYADAPQSSAPSRGSRAHPTAPLTGGRGPAAARGRRPSAARDPARSSRRRAGAGCRPPRGSRPTSRPCGRRARRCA